VVVETTVLATVVVVEAVVPVASTSLTDGWPLVLSVAELPVLSNQEVSVVLRRSWFCWGLVKLIRRRRSVLQLREVGVSLASLGTRQNQRRYYCQQRLCQ
jgi:hypothetical protein